MEIDAKDVDGDSQLRFHACTAHLGWINETVGGITPDSIERVERWTVDQIAIIMTTPEPSAFLEPFGFAKFIM